MSFELQLIEEAAAVTGFKRSVIELLFQEFTEESGGTDDDFLNYIGRLCADASFILAASKGFSVDGCLAAYDYGYKSVLDGLLEGDLESIIDEIEIKGLPNTEDDA
jgi:hypothetical protein